MSSLRSLAVARAFAMIGCALVAPLLTRIPYVCGPSVFRHPGILTNRARLERVRGRVEPGDRPGPGGVSASPLRTI